MSPTLTKQPKVIFCDVDKTLTRGNTWFTLTSELHGDVEKHFQLYSAYLKGKIALEEMKKGLFAMWEEGYGAKISRRVLEDILFKVQLRGEAFSTFSELRNLGYKLCLVSSSMDMFVKMVAERLQLEDWYANAQFIFDEENRWVDFTYDKNEAELKLKQIREYLDKHDIKDDQCLVLGRGPGEIELFKHFPGIAINSEDEKIRQLAWRDIKYLPTVLQILQEIS
jgi:HAD superfamily phosphoserine phosphatase-like hydrolase